MYSELYSKYVVKEIDIDYVPLKIQTVLFILGAVALKSTMLVPGNSKLFPPPQSVSNCTETKNLANFILY